VSVSACHFNTADILDVDRCENLTELDLGGNALRATGLEAVARALRAGSACKRLRVLRLPRVQCDEGGGHALAEEALRWCSRLEVWCETALGQWSAV
jgi:hypothetical protein